MNEIRCRIELRADETRQSPGRIVGELLTYGARALDRPETFAPDALSWPEDGIVLNLQHDRRAIVTRFIPEVRGKQVVIDKALPDTAMGRDVATLVRDGTLTGLSIEFRSTDEGMRAGMREIRSARLMAAAVVDAPSHKSSVEVRQRQGGGRRVWL